MHFRRCTSKTSQGENVHNFALNKDNFCFNSNLNWCIHIRLAYVIGIGLACTQATTAYLRVLVHMLKRVSTNKGCTSWEFAYMASLSLNSGNWRERNKGHIKLLPYWTGTLFVNPTLPEIIVCTPIGAIYILPALACDLCMHARWSWSHVQFNAMRVLRDVSR